MLKKFLSSLNLVLLALLMANCGGSKFVIQGEFSDGGTQSIRIVYATSDGVKSNWGTMKDGKFKYQGEAPDYTVAYIYNAQGGFIAHVVVKNGEEVKLKGEINKPYRLKITGSDENEDWNDFITTNVKLFEKGNSSMIDIAIEKYIRENKDNMVSTLLLFNDYSNLSNEANVKKLLAMIDPDACPASLVNGYKLMKNELDESTAKKVVYSLMLYSTHDSVEVFSPFKGKVNFLCFWRVDDNNRPMMIDRIRSLSDEFGSDKRLQLADVTLDNDTAQWKQALGQIKTPWKHYWSIGGVANSSISDLKIKNTPLFIVTDSAGKQLYRGPAIDGALSKARSLLQRK